MMSKLYIGNLPTDINELNIRKLFSEHGLTTTNVFLKRGGYAFIDCDDQTAIDIAIEKLNGSTYNGHSLVVEPSVAGGGAKCSLLEARVRVSGVPVNVDDEELEKVLSSVGQVDKCEKYASRDGQTQVVQVAFQSADEAREAAIQLNGYELRGVPLRVERLMDKKVRTTKSSGGQGGHLSRGVMGGSPVMQRHTEFPLRILVPSEMVGAIIGRQGATIRAITQQTRARVDVHRKDNTAGSVEKAITIYGNPENCTKACKRILEVMQEESESTNKDIAIHVKILAHNNLIGRIIGKGGATIKKIMEETNTVITVSSISEISSFNLERIISIKGSIEDISKAESVISAKLRLSFESDLQTFAPQTAMFPGLHPMAMMSTLGFGMSRSSNGNSQGLYNTPPASYPSMYSTPFSGLGGMQQTNEETAYLFIPNSSVGAVIGTKGSNIRNLIRFSGASVRISPLEDECNDSRKSPDEQEQPERRVTIIGTPDAQWKAQFLIFDKIREEGYTLNLEDVRLTVELVVPSAQVGRIIGKGGQNVRDLQRQTGSLIKLPQQGQPSSEESSVHVYGTFYSIQSAQRRIRSILTAAANRNKSPIPRI